MDHSVRGSGDVHLPQASQAEGQEPATTLPSSLRGGVHASISQVREFIRSVVPGMLVLSPALVPSVGGILIALIGTTPTVAVAIGLGAVIIWSIPSRNFPEQRETIKTTQGDIRQNPKQLLDQLMERFNNKKFVDRLHINLIDTVGVDASGLSRQFICDLFSALAEKLSFKEYQNGLFRPELQPDQEYLDPADEKTYRDIGRLLMFCLNAAESYPIGMVFDRGVYAGIQAFPDAWLERDFATLTDTKNVEKENFDTLFTIYAKMHEHNKIETKTVTWLKTCFDPWDENTPDSVIERAYETAENYLPEDKQGCNDIKEIRKLGTIGEIGTIIQNALRKHCMRAFLIPKLAPLHAMACGMRGAEFQSLISWQDVKAVNTNILEEAIQGIVTVEKILKKLTFRQVPNDQQEWVKKWIKGGDEQTLKPDEKIRHEKNLKKFLYILTGSNSLGRKDLIVGNTSSGNVVFHTCFNMLDFPFKALQEAQNEGDAKANTYENFKATLEAAIEGKAGFDIE